MLTSLHDKKKIRESGSLPTRPPQTGRQSRELWPGAGMNSFVRNVVAVWLVAGLSAVSVAAWAGAPVFPARVVATVPHDPAAFTQGLLFHDGALYESTGLYGESSLRRVDPATGRVLAKRAVPRNFFGEGLALADGRLYQLTWREGRVLVYRLADFAPLGQWPLTTEGWGACLLGGDLVVSDGSDKLFFYAPGTMTLRRTVSVTDGGEPVTRLNELETVGATVWANVWGDTRIAVIDPVSGQVLAWVDCAALLPGVTTVGLDDVLNGIAWDPATGRLWVTGKHWPEMYQIKVPGLPLGQAGGIGQ